MREKLLEDIRRACEELALFLEEKVPTDLEQDRGLQLIVEREFEIIGEAMNRLQRADEAAFAKITHGHRIIGGAQYSRTWLRYHRSPNSMGCLSSRPSKTSRRSKKPLVI